MWRSAKFQPQLQLQPLTAVVDVSCSRHAGALCATSPRTCLSLASPCLRAVDAAMRAVPPRPPTRSSAHNVGAWTCPRHMTMRHALSRKTSTVLRTCIPPVSTPLGRHLRCALECAVAALADVMRGLREKGIASRRRIRFGRGCERHMQRVLALLGLLLRWWWWMCRGRVARVCVGSRRLGVWVVHRMAVWRTREGRRRLAGVHGAAGHWGSSSSQAAVENAHATKNAGRRTQNAGRGSGSRLQREATGTSTEMSGDCAGGTSRKTVSAGRASHSAQDARNRSASIPCRKVGQQPR